MSELVSAVLLGIVEGLTEFIPVSSTGHLVLVSQAISLSGPKIATFNVFIQLGAILAVVFLYFRRFLGLLDFSARETSSFSGYQGLTKLGLACLPVFVAGALFHSRIKSLLSDEKPVALALLVGGVVMIIVEMSRKRPSVETLEELSYRQCLLIGLFQCFSLWPGVSRSGSTIVGAMLVGVHRRVAAEFSFLVAVPVMFAAVGYDLLKSYKELSFADLPMFAVGFIVAFVSALLAVRLFIGMLQRMTLKPFGYYRILLALAVLWLTAG